MGFEEDRQAALARVQLLRPGEVAQILGVSKQTLYMWRKHKKGPAYVQLAPKVVRYRAVDILGWRKAERVKTASTLTESGTEHSFYSPMEITHELVREQLNDVALAIHHLPLWAFQQVRSMTVQEIATEVLDVEWEDEAESGKKSGKTKKKAAPPRTASKPDGKSKAKKEHAPGTKRPKSTVELDERVLAVLTATGEDTPITEIITALASKYRKPENPKKDMYNAQQIRRSLARMIESGQVEAEGKTKSKIYRAL